MPDVSHGTVDAPHNTATVAGIPFAVTTLDEAVDWLCDASKQGVKSEPLPIRLANAYCVALASNDKKYRSVLQGEGINFPDGTPVVWVMRLSRRESKHVRGPSFFVEIIRRGQERGLRHFFLGSTNETLEKLSRNIEMRYPSAIIAGSYAPPFGPLDADFYRVAAELISACRPDVVWVGLGTPKQDFASVELTRRTGVHCVGVGAAFDFLAETVPEAPRWIQNSGFEWVFRLVAEPRRLWRRYLIGNLQFVWAIVRRTHER